MDDFDIEDIGNKKQTQDTIEKPSNENAILIQKYVESKDFENALDLFGDDLINEDANDIQSNNIDILHFKPNTYVEFKRYEKAIVNFYSSIPNASKAEFAQKLIINIIRPLNSYQIEDILQTNFSIHSSTEDFI